MSDEHVQGTDPDLAVEDPAAGGHQDRAEQWERDAGAESTNDDGPQDTAGQWTGGGDAAQEDTAEQWSGGEPEPGAQDTPQQWYEESADRSES